MRKNRRNRIKHILAMMLFCMVMSIGMVCFADEQGTVTVKSAKIRASADASSEQVGSAAQGKKVDIIGKTTGTDGKVWYQVYVDANTKGFIRGDLMDVPNAANIKTVDGSASTQPAESTVTSVESRQVVVINNNSNIRKDASTSSEPVATVNNGKVLTVIGETDGADGYKWYQVSFTYSDTEVTGYVRSDVVSDNVPADLEPSEADGNINPGEDDLPETAPEGEQSSGQANQSNNIINPMNVDEEPPYIMAGFKARPFTLPSDDQEYNAYINGDFLICYGITPDGEEGWFLVDNKMKVCQRYVYTAEGVTVPKGNAIDSIGLVPIIVLVVIIIILVAVVGLLLLKLREHGASYKSYGDDDDDYQDDEIEDLEELEEDEKPQPIRRPQGATTQQPARRPQERVVQQPPRRPQGNPQSGPSGNGAPQERVIQQPARRPQGSPQPARRPQGSPQNPQSGSSGNGAPQPIRRPQGGNPANGAVRPQQPLPRHPQTNTGQLPLRPTQQQPQNDKAQMQKGYKAKNLLDDDMDFMDIE